MAKIKRKVRKREFRGVPVREARAAIHVQPNQDDIKNATTESPTNCMYARCLKRVYDSPTVFIFKEIAYIQTLDEEGRAIMERYHIRKYARETIRKFDHGEKIAPGGFVFDKPPSSKLLKNKEKAYQRLKDRGYKNSRTVTGKKKDVKHMSLRSGRGRVHLLGNEDQIRPIDLIN